MSRAVASASGSWLDHLPFVLLGMRSSVREDSLCSPADLVFGSPLRLPGDMLVPSEPVPLASDFASRLRSVMHDAAPMPVSYHGAPTSASRLEPALQSVSHVFLRVDAVRRPLVPPYIGPFPVLRRGPKTFDILQGKKTVTVSIDRLKPAHSLPDVPAAAAPVPVQSPCPVAPAAPAEPRPPERRPPALDPDVWPLPTRFGRRPRPPDRLNL